jgi:S1-C subfamily serine protease
MMRTTFAAKTLTLIVSALLLVTPGTGMAQGQPHVLPAVATLSVQRADGGTATGTAFLAVRDGLLVTTLHALEDATRVTATFSDGEVFDCIGLVDQDARHNVALVRIREFGRSMLTLSPTEMAVGDSVSAAVVKDGAFGLLRVRVENAMTPGGIKFYGLAGQIPNGNNGAPVVNAAGAVVGMTMSLTINNQTIPVALPSSYILALEPSLPVKPWAATASAQATRAAPAAAGTPAAAAAPADTAAPAADPADTVLAGVFRQVYFLASYYTPYSQHFYDFTRYNNTKNLNLYSVQSDIDVAIQKLQWLKPTDPARTTIVQALGQYLASERQGIGFLITCWNLEKDVGPDKNIPEAKNAAEQAAAVFASVPSQVAALQPTVSQLAANSPAFVAALSPELSVFLGITQRKSTLDLGVYVQADAPMDLISVTRHGLADKLGLQPGDSIISAAGHTFTANETTDDFAMVIQQNAGKQIEIVIKRDDKLKTLDKKVPGDVIQKYGGS